MLAPTTAGDELAYQNLLGLPLNNLRRIEGKLTVSDNIEIVSSGNETTSSGIHVESGSELVNPLAVGTHLNATFLGLKVDIGANVTAEFGANFGTSIDGKKGDSFEEYQKQRMTTASVIGGDHESSLKLRREPDSKDRYAEWAESNNKAINSAVIELTVHTLPKLIHDCGVAKWEDMDRALEHFTQSVSPQG
ncbi:unnamed protein product [Penicillium viridicatum]